VNKPSDDSDPGSRSRLSTIVALAIVVALCAFLAWWLKPPPPEPAPAKPAVQTVPEPAPAEPARPAAQADSSSKRPAPRDAGPSTRATAPTPTPAPSQTADTPVLRVTSDVAGAFVFVDRKYLGKTPLETRDVAAGPHQVQVSAEGYEGVSRSIDVASSGPTEVSVLLGTVVLDASVPVVHKHRLGSCQGSLIADVHGLRYQTTNRNDAWTMPFSDVETFDLDYQEKNLRVKRRQGRTWNFTTKAVNADPLLVFKREVDSARVKLARQSER
jgi:hypothetical protein